MSLASLPSLSDQFKKTINNSQLTDACMNNLIQSARYGFHGTTIVCASLTFCCLDQISHCDQTLHSKKVQRKQRKQAWEGSLRRINRWRLGTLIQMLKSAREVQVSCVLEVEKKKSPKRGRGNMSLGENPVTLQGNQSNRLCPQR